MAFRQECANDVAHLVASIAALDGMPAPPCLTEYAQVSSEEFDAQTPHPACHISPAKRH